MIGVREGSRRGAGDGRTYGRREGRGVSSPSGPLGSIKGGVMKRIASFRHWRVGARLLPLPLAGLALAIASIVAVGALSSPQAARAASPINGASAACDEFTLTILGI